MNTVLYFIACGAYGLFCGVRFGPLGMGLSIPVTIVTGLILQALHII